MRSMYLLEEGLEGVEVLMEAGLMPPASVVEGSSTKVPSFLVD